MKMNENDLVPTETKLKWLCTTYDPGTYSVYLEHTYQVYYEKVTGTCQGLTRVSTYMVLPGTCCLLVNYLVHDK